MALIGTEEEDNLPQSSSSANAHATYQGAPTPSGGGGSGFVGGSGSGSGQGATTSAVAPHSAGGGYSNLSQYLQANQDSGATTGQAAENVVQQSANQANDALNQYQTSAGNQIGSSPSSPKSINDFSGQAANDQTAYFGAKSNLDQNINNANGGTYGAQALLSRAYQSPNYTQGERSLDGFLANTSGALGGANALGSGVAQNYSNINAMLGNKITDARNKAEAANAQSLQLASAVRPATPNPTYTASESNPNPPANPSEGENELKVDSEGNTTEMPSNEHGNVGTIVIDGVKQPDYVDPGVAPTHAKPTTGQIPYQLKRSYMNDNDQMEFAHGGEVPAYSKLRRILK